MAVATVWELPLSQMIVATGPRTGHFVAINAATAIVILLVAGILRVNGYFLCAQSAVPARGPWQNADRT